MKTGVYNAPVSFEVGDIFPSKESGDMVVVYNESSRNVGVRFLDTGTEIRNLQRGNVIRGVVSDYMKPSVMGKGYIGKPRKEVSSKSIAYSRWHSMLERCYDPKYHSVRETYKDCTVCEDWFNFCNFEVWFEDNYVKGYDLDKDLLVQGNRVYSPETCCFIPPKLNALIVEKQKGDCGTGVYKRRKKGSQEYNGLYNVSFGGKYIGRFKNQSIAEDRYREFKKLFFEEYADLEESRGNITSEQAEALRNRRV